MVNALIKCGAKPGIKPLIHRMWAGYLRKMGIAYTGETVNPDDPPPIIPVWWTKFLEEEANPQANVEKPTPFAPKKVYVNFLSKLRDVTCVTITLFSDQKIPLPVELENYWIWRTKI